jgi:hypothetical protein
LPRPPLEAVPQGAYARRRDLSTGEWSLYQAYCRFRDPETGRCDPTNKELAEELGYTTVYISDCKTKLVREGWIRRLGKYAVELLVGEFPRPTVAEFEPAKIGKFRSSGSENSDPGRLGDRKNPITRSENSDHGAARPFNDLDLDQDDDDSSSAAVFAFYSRHTGNFVNANDRQAYRAVAHLPERVIYAGILLSLLRAKRHVNSLKYCLGAIREAADMRPSAEYVNFLASELARKQAQVQPNLPGVGAPVVEADFGRAAAPETTAEEIRHPPAECEPGSAALWAHVSARLNEQLPPQQFETWIKPLVPVCIRQGRIELWAFNEVFRDWVEATFGERIRRALAEAPGERGVSDFGWWDEDSSSPAQAAAGGAS